MTKYYKGDKVILTQPLCDDTILGYKKGDILTVSEYADTSKSQWIRTDDDVLFLSSQIELSLESLWKRIKTLLK